MDCDHGYQFVLLRKKTLKLIICKTRSGLQKDNSLKTCVLKENIIVGKLIPAGTGLIVKRLKKEAKLEQEENSDITENE